MAYRHKIEESSSSKKSFDEIFQYLFFKVGDTGNAQAAYKFYKEYKNLLQRLTYFPRSYAFCSNEQLRAMGLRKARLAHMKYKVLFHLEDKTVVIDFIFHDSQDYENLI